MPTLSEEQREVEIELKEIYKALIVITSCLVLDIEDIVKDCDRYRRSSIVHLCFLFLFASFLPDNVYQDMAKMESRVDIDKIFQLLSSWFGSGVGGWVIELAET